MGFFDSILGRSKPKGPDLDALFQVPSAALTLFAGLGLKPAGTGTVCYRGALGPAFAQVESEVVDLLAAADSEMAVRTTTDGFGFTWMVIDSPAAGAGDVAGPAVSDLCTALHAVNTSLEVQGFGHGLLCTLVPFVSASGQRVGLVYLYKQGTFYPFAPLPGANARDPRRDNLLEIQVRDVLGGELPVEKHLQRWLALWDAPGL